MFNRAFTPSVARLSLYAHVGSGRGAKGAPRRSAFLGEMGPLLGEIFARSPSTKLGPQFRRGVPRDRQAVSLARNLSVDGPLVLLATPRAPDKIALHHVLCTAPQANLGTIETSFESFHSTGDRERNMGFLDGVSNGFNRGVESASRTAQTAKLRAQLNSLQKQRQDLAATLGESLYPATKDRVEFTAGREGLYQSIAGIDSQCDAINQQIAQLEAEASGTAAASSGYTCPRCGVAVDEGDLFCTNCGLPLDQAKADQPAETPVAAPATPAPAGVRTCPNCGSPVPDGDMFCMNCGARVDGAPAETEPAEGVTESEVAPESEPAPDSAPEPVPEPAPK